MIKTIIVAEVKLFREGLACALISDGRVRLVDSLSSRHDILDSVRRCQPHVVLIELTGPASLVAFRTIARLDSSIALIALAVSESEREIIACAEAGADGYVTRDGSIQDLIQTIEASMKGELKCSPRIARSLFHHVRVLAIQTNGAPANGLTSREDEILDLIEQGFSNKRIARSLGIEVATVKNHVHNILGKLGVNCRGEAAAKRRIDSNWPAEGARVAAAGHG